MVDKSQQTTPPLADQNAELVKGVEFSDNRHSSSGNKETLEVALVDQKSVVLEDSNGNRRFEGRDQFEENIGERWQIETHPDNIDEADEKERQIEKIKRGVENKKESYLNNPDEPAKGIRKNTLNAILANLNVVDAMNPINLEDISGIGEKTAENINSAGIKTNFDVLCASIDRLKSINGVGEGTAKRMKEAAGEKEKEKPFRSSDIEE